MTVLDVTIMDLPYNLSCKEGEERALRETVDYLDKRMCAIRDAGKVKGNDRIAVMAALAITAELLSTKSPSGPLSEMTMSEVRQKIAVMHGILDDALAPQENLF